MRALAPAEPLELGPGPLGIMSDLHGNVQATEAVIADARSLGVDRWLVLGDVVAMGPDPVGVLRLLDDLDVVAAIAGNTERYVLTGDLPFPTYDDAAADPTLIPRLAECVGSFAWTRGTLCQAEMLARITGFTGPATLVLPDGTRMMAVHASPASDDGPGIGPDVDPVELAPLLAGVDADIVVGGHTHQPTDRVVDGRRWLNPGSVSNPHSVDKSARWLVLHCEQGGHRVEPRSVGYDVGAVRQRIAACGIPGAGFLLDRYFGPDEHDG